MSLVLWMIVCLLCAYGFLRLFGWLNDKAADIESPAEQEESRQATQAQAECNARARAIMDEMAQRRGIPVQLPKREKVHR